MRTYLSFLLISALLIACRPENQKKVEEKKDWGKEHSVDFNQELNAREQLEISAFLRHHNYLKMDTTSSGLRYMIYNKTKGDKVKMGNEVSVNVKIERLDGTICYQTDTISGKESIMIGKSDVESGIQEGIRLMRLGEKAKFILPSYLGHGLLGDRYTIPPQAILYVDVKLLEIK